MTQVPDGVVRQGGTPSNPGVMTMPSTDAAAEEQRFRLVSGVSYGLKETLGTAAQFADLLAGDPELPDLQRSYALRLRRSLDTALRLIGELHDFTRAESGRLAIAREPANAGALLRDMAKDAALAAGTTGLDIRVEVPPELPIVHTDVDCVRQILDALLTNAVRYTPSSAHVLVAARTRDGRRTDDPTRWLCLTVADGGPGIPDPDALFDEAGRSETPGAVGFRLAISRRIARLLGGDLTVEQRRGGGAIFTLWLPAGPPPQA